MQEDLVAHVDAPGVEPCSEPANVVPEIAVGPGADASGRWVPDQGRMVRSVLGPKGQQPRDVLPLHLVSLQCGRCCIHRSTHLCRLERLSR